VVSVAVAVEGSVVAPAMVVGLERVVDWVEEEGLEEALVVGLVLAQASVVAVDQGEALEQDMEEDLVVEVEAEAEGDSTVPMVVVSVAEVELEVVFTAVVEGLEAAEEEASAVGMVEALALDWV
jgi:hypothetical protein